jgi:hypothetical protein
MPRLSSHFGLQDPRLQSLAMPMILPLTLTAAAVLTSPQLLQGFIIVNAAAGVNLTLPAAADLVNNIQGSMVGTSFELEVRSIGAGTATLVAGTGGTINGTATVATLNTRTFLFNITNVTLGQEAYTVYSKGTGTY